MIEVKNLEHRYDHKTILRVPEFQAKVGRITAIVGPSAAGKSTFIRLLAGLEPPSQGKIYLKQQRLNANHLRKHASLVLQQPIAFRGTVLSNAMLAPKLLRKSKQEASELAEENLKLVGLENIVKQNAKKLSGGELVRLALARALAKDPDILLLDEATANLDPANIIRLEQVIQTVAEKGKTIIMVTHNLPQAKRLSQQTAVILEGEMICLDKSENIFTEHPDPRVRAFISGEIVF